jgi:4-amino-4-deoxy-L-arabinose transferase-like glycosyltransferase
MIAQRTKWLVISLFVVWMFFTLGSFFTVQKPFSAANISALGNAFLDLLTAGWLVLVGVAIGHWVLRQILRIDVPLIETLILGAGLGLGVLGLLDLALGLLGLFRPVVAYGILIVLTLIFVRQLGHLLRRYRRWSFTQRPHWLAALYLSLIGCLTLSVALLPPTDWDGLFYHLTGPELYLESGQIVGGIDIPHLNFPGLMEMLFTWAMLLRGDIAAKLLHTCFGLLLAGLVYLTAHRFLGRKSAWPAVLVFASMPMVGTLAGWAYNDLALAFYQLASLYAIVHWIDQRQETGDRRPLALGPKGVGVTGDPAQIPFLKPATQTISDTGETSTPNPQSAVRNPQHLHFVQAQVSAIRNHSWLVLSGIFAGLAMGLKYTSFVTPLVVGCLILLYSMRSLRNPQSATPNPQPLAFSNGLLYFISFALVASLTALPWYAKNWAFTGNPVYPFLSGVFGGQFWDSFRANWYAAAGTGIGFQPKTLIALPWLLTLGIRDMNYWDGRTGPLLLLFLPMVLFYSLWLYRRHDPDRPLALTPLLIYVLAQFGFWTLGVIWSRSLWQSRLLLPALVALAPLAGWVWANLSRLDLPQFSLRRFVNLAITLTLALTLVDVGLLTLQINPLPYLAGLETRDQYLTRRLGAYYETMQQLNQELPPEAVVLFLWEPRSYYCRRDCRPDSILDEFPHTVYQHGTADAIAQSWQQAGITHVLIHRSGLRFMLNESPDVIDTAVLDALEAHALDPIFDVAGAYQLYGLLDHSSEVNKQE